MCNNYNFKCTVRNACRQALSERPHVVESNAGVYDNMFKVKEMLKCEST